MIVGVYQDYSKALFGYHIENDNLGIVKSTSGPGAINVINNIVSA